MSGEHLLDVTELEPPEPLERALQAVAALRAGCFVKMLHRREPLLLYPMLEERGFAWIARPGRDVPFEILIWRAGDADAEAAASAGHGS